MDPGKFERDPVRRFGLEQCLLYQSQSGLLCGRSSKLKLFVIARRRQPRVKRGGQRRGDLAAGHGLFGFAPATRPARC